MDRKRKMGVLRSMCYTISTIWHADKGCVLFAFYKNLTEEVFDTFFVIYVMQYTYTRIERGSGFHEVLVLITCFCLGHVLIHIASASYAYYNRKKTPQVYRYVFNKVIDKAETIELTRYEQPDFYDRFSKALDECLTKAMEGLHHLTWALGCLLATIVAIWMIVEVDPYLVFFIVPPVLVSFICGAKVNEYQYMLRNEETKDKRVTEYAKRVFYEKKYASEIRLYEVAGILLGKQRKSYDSLYEINHRIYKKIFLYKFLQRVLCYCVTMIGTYLFVSYRIKVEGIAKIGAYIAMMSALNYVSWRVGETVRYFIESGRCCMYMNNLEDFLTYETTELVDGTIPITEELGTISLKDVSFTYSGSKKPVIKHLSLDIKKGEKIALVGENGAGKTTLVKLLMRLYPVSEGEIDINGTDINDYRQSELHEHFGTVFQDLQIFSLPLSHNVLMKEPENAAERKLCEEALEKAQFGDTLAKLPKGIDTMITKEFDEDGFVCSGGQAQKIAIARVFAKNPDIVILDEPSSALDPIAEYRMYNNMLLVSEGKTCIFISHRLSSARIADRIIYLENGQILENGSHEELMAQNGRYAEMFHLQAKNYQEQKKNGEIAAREVPTNA